MQTVLAADDCRKKKNQNTKEKKEGPPQTKGLKKNKTCMARNGGSYCLGGSWNLLQSMNRIVLRKEHRWLAGRTWAVFPTSVYILGFKFAWIFDFFYV